MPDGDEIEFRNYLGVLWRRWRVLLLTVVVIVALVFVNVSGKKGSYRSTAEVLVQASSSEQVLGESDARNAEPSVRTEIEVMASESVRSAAAKTLGADPDVSITQVGDTNVVVVTARSRNKEQARRAAQVYSDTYVTVRREQLVSNFLGAIDIVQHEITALDAQIAQSDGPLRDLNAQILATFDPVRRSQLQAERDALVDQRSGPLSRREAFQEQLDQLRLASNLTKTGGAQVLSAASEPARQGTNKRRWLVMGFALGLILGVVAAFTREHFDDTLRSKDDFERGWPALPALALVPTARGWHKRKTPYLVSLVAPASQAAEAYRRLRTAFAFSMGAESARIAQITSPNHGEGKSATSANLALSLARAGRRVTLVDGNLRHPRAHEFFAAGNGVGLSTVLAGDAPLEAALQTVPDEPLLRILASGPIPTNPGELLSKGPLRHVLTTIADGADIVIVDSPPVLPITDATVLAEAVDAVVIVVSAGRTHRADLEASLEMLAQVKGRLIGAVLNKAQLPRRRLTLSRNPYAPRGRRWNLGAPAARPSVAPRSEAAMDRDTTGVPIRAGD